MATSDPFALLGLPRTFDLDTAALRRSYLARSATLHPDVLTAADQASASGTDAAALNHAMRTLENPELRADALLALLGGPAKELDRTLPPGFLQEMLEIRELIDADLANLSDDRRAHWEQWADHRRREHQSRVAELFHSPSPLSPATLSAIRHELNAWRYIERLIEQLDPA